MHTFFNKIKNTNSSIHAFLKINPHRHWGVLVNMFFVIFFLIILFSFYLLYQVKNEKIFQVKDEQKGEYVLLNEDLLKKTIELFDRKSTEETKIKNNPSPYKDPSI